MTLNFAEKWLYIDISRNRKDKRFWTGMVNLLIGLLVWVSVLLPLLVKEVKSANVVDL